MLNNIESLLAQRCDQKQLQQIIEVGTQQHFAFYVQLLLLFVLEPNYNKNIATNIIDKVLLMTQDRAITGTVLRLKWRMLTESQEWYGALQVAAYLQDE